MLVPVGRLRSLLFAPAVRPDFLEKLPERGADAVVIDCEDSTPPVAKAEGRSNALMMAPGLAGRGCPVMVRVNSPATEWFATDIDEGLAPELTAVVIPKVESVASLDEIAAALDSAGHHDLGVVAGLETALGVADARPLLAHHRVVAGYFGAEDFIADMGGRRSPGNAEVQYARSHVALAGRLAGVPTLDQVVTDFGNDEAFAWEASEARNLGYSGKLCIHPGQVGLANAAFTPSQAEVERARALIEAYETAAREGVSAIDFDGQMVDEPLATQARQIIAASE